GNLSGTGGGGLVWTRFFARRAGSKSVYFIGKVVGMMVDNVMGVFGAFVMGNVVFEEWVKQLQHAGRL
ncbi:hypothetical protein A2U01_0072336, partial [Trifolium medium]|nr:hypothetical protein [Trifolium medium]